MKTPVTGKTLIDWGYASAPWFTEALKKAENFQKAGHDEAAIKAMIAEIAEQNKTLELGSLRPLDVGICMEVLHEGDPEIRDHTAKVFDALTSTTRLPNVHKAAMLPDACYAPGSLPVGGVVSSKDIHPAWHSADVCCSVAMTVFKDDIDPKLVMDTGMSVSHFGPGGRPRSGQIWPDEILLKKFYANEFAKHLVSEAIEFNGTQGDGNHFFYVGRLRSTGQVTIVTHHGSRKPGALLYKMGMEEAQKHTRRACPNAALTDAWIPGDSIAGRDYWEALQIIREWTKNNHFVIHNRVRSKLKLTVAREQWNEHNFVFQKSDGLFYHAKGATPAWDGYANDWTGTTLVPLNMAKPILVIEGSNNARSLGFAPHGAGRHLSRSAFVRLQGSFDANELIKSTAPGIDVRFYLDEPDISELPIAYKDADDIERQINKYGLAKIVDYVDPYGTIMAGKKVWKKS